MTAEATIERLRPGDIGWTGFLSLYRSTFAEWEREDESRIEARAGEGRYRVHVLGTRAGDVAGFHVMDQVRDPPYGILTFVAVAPEKRGAGLGLRLVGDALARHRREPGAPTLLVEARDAPARLYARAGFRALALDFRVPHYDDPRGETPMWLLADAAQTGVSTLDGRWLRAVVRQMFGDGYGLRRADPRLLDQLSRIPDTVRLADAAVSSGTVPAR